jgi:hypothetical protein
VEKWLEEGTPERKHGLKEKNEYAKRYPEIHRGPD